MKQAFIPFMPRRGTVKSTFNGAGKASGQQGAALLMAMLTVTLVATLASSALWQQQASIDMETAERGQVQSNLLQTASMDWARQVLRDDAASGPADHLGEAWAKPLNAGQLAAFLSIDKSAGETGSGAAQEVEQGVLLSGQISDLQNRLNVMNLIRAKAISEPDLLSFSRLFALLNLPQEQLKLLANELLLASGQETNGALMPQRVEQLIWLGLAPETVQALAPYITLLPERTTINLNTASAEVIHASVADLPMDQARQLVAQRDAKPFRALADAQEKDPAKPQLFKEEQHAVESRFFEVRSNLRFRQTTLLERAVVQREGSNVRVIWRSRTALPAQKSA